MPMCWSAQALLCTDTASMLIPFFSKNRDHIKYYDRIRSELVKVQEMIASQTDCFEPSVAKYMDTVTQSRGKMLRPSLVMLAAGTVGTITQEHVKLGAILEMVHMASLVHDDVIDHADTRRGHDTPNALWGNNLAVLLGDALFAHAMVLGTDFESIDFCRRLGTIVRDVCQGEVEQSSRLFELDMPREDYYKIIRMKTASLFSAATGGAAWLARIDDERVNDMYKLGEVLGIAYQIYDDCLDLVGDEDDAGKTLHTDAEKGKLTLPIFNLLESDDEVGKMVRSALEREQSPDYEKIQDTETYRDAIKKAVDEAKHLTATAREILWHFEPSEHRAAFSDLTIHLDSLLDKCVP